MNLEIGTYKEAQTLESTKIEASTTNT
jgi:hypothetical protein